MKAAQARILLTGAAGGIGREAAAAFAGAGAAVMLAGRSPARLSALARSLGRDSRVNWFAADLRDGGQIERLAAASAEWGCNVVVHGAGAAAFGGLESQHPDTMIQALHTNLLAPMLLTRAMLGHLERQPRAQVLCVGSVLGRLALPGYSVYCATKFGLRGFAEALRRELAGTSVRVQYLGPRSTRTDFNNADVDSYNRATGTATDPPAAAAAAMLRMLEDESAERFLGFPERLAVRINGLAPTWLDGSFARHSRSVAGLDSNPERMTT